MNTAKLFQHGGSQAVRLPKAFRFTGTEVLIEKHGAEVILKPSRHRDLPTLHDVARYMREKFPIGKDFPEIERPVDQQTRDLNLD